MPKYQKMEVFTVVRLFNSLVATITVTLMTVHGANAMNKASKSSAAPNIVQPSKNSKKDRVRLTTKESPFERLVGSYPARIIDIAQAIKNIHNDTVSTQSISNIFLLHGPRGNGKTTLPHAIADYANATYLFCTASDFFADKNKSVQRIDEFFDTAFKHTKKDKKSVVILLDEIGSIIKSRTCEQDPQITIVADCLCTKLDRVRQEPKIFFFCTTNLPTQELYPTFLARLSDHDNIYIPNPSYEDIRTLVSYYLRKKFGTLVTEEFLAQVAQKAIGLDRRRIYIAITIDIPAIMAASQENEITEDVILESIQTQQIKQQRLNHLTEASEPTRMTRIISNSGEFICNTGVTIIQSVIIAWGIKTTLSFLDRFRK